jgi:deoxyribonuclease V
MNIPRVPHAWRLSPRQAIRVQQHLAGQVLVIKPETSPRLVAGLDAAFSPDGQYCLAAVVLWDVAGRCVVDQVTAARKLVFPYIPGLLSFREAPALLAALRRLAQTPDVLLCDGQGLAHPRRFGLACHLGVICQCPAIGCAKSRLIGRHEEPGHQRGSYTPLLVEQEVVGEVLRTQTGIKPVYLSVGHRMDLPSARRLVLDCALQYRLPEPTRLADRLVAAEKRQCGRRAGGRE